MTNRFIENLSIFFLSQYFSSLSLKRTSSKCLDIFVNRFLTRIGADINPVISIIHKSVVNCVSTQAAEEAVLAKLCHLYPGLDWVVVDAIIVQGPF